MSRKKLKQVRSVILSDTLGDVSNMQKRSKYEQKICRG